MDANGRAGGGATSNDGSVHIMKRIFITGGTGFFGKSILSRLCLTSAATPNGRDMPGGHNCIPPPRKMALIAAP